MRYISHLCYIAYAIHIAYPFKFNRAWLCDPEFKLVVEHYWTTLNDLVSSTAMDTFLLKLAKVKQFVMKWTNQEKNDNSRELSLVESN